MIVWLFYLIKFLIVVFLPASPFIPTSPFINFGGFCHPPRLLHPPGLLFWQKFTSIPVYSVLPFYLTLESMPGSYHNPYKFTYQHWRDFKYPYYYNGNDVMYLWQDYGSLKRVQLLFIRNIIFYKKQWQQMYIKFWKLSVKVPIIRI